jgi:DNA polymerase IIIc chi subunit
VAKGSGCPLDFTLDDDDAKEKILIYILRSSARLRAMLPILMEQVLDLGEKAIVWGCFPAQQALVYGVRIWAFHVPSYTLV